MEKYSMDEITIEPMTDTSVIHDFECGISDMDEFIQNTLQSSINNHYCCAYLVRNSEDTIIGMFAIAFDSLELDDDDKSEVMDGISTTGIPSITSDYMNYFLNKFSYPALEIKYLAINKQFQCKGYGKAIIDNIVKMAQTQTIAGCQFLTVEALVIKGYNAVGFYEKCDFSPCELLSPIKDTRRMFRTLYPQTI